MIKKLVGLLTNNILLKILSVLVAVALWLVVVNYDDPTITNTYSGIKVDIINTDVLTDQGKVYEVINGSDTVDVTVEGPRSVIDGIGKENITAVADMAQMTEVDTLPIELSTNKNSNRIENIIGDHGVVQLNIEKRIDKHLPVELVLNGEPAEGFIVGDTVMAQNTVRISGPESVVSKIVAARCAVSVAGRSSDISSSSDIHLYDADGREVDHPNLSKNISTINVNVGILETKDITVNFSITGEPAEGYAVEGVPVADKSTIKVAGKSNILDGLYSISVPSDVVEVDGKTEAFSVQVDMSDYLPNGVKLADEDPKAGIINVVVGVVPLTEKTLKVPIENLKVINVPEGYNAELMIENGDDEEVTENNVTLDVVTEGIEHYYMLPDGTEFSGDDMMGQVDIQSYFDAAGSNVSEGVYRIKIVFETPVGVSVKGTAYADVRLSLISQDATD